MDSTRGSERLEEMSDAELAERVPIEVRVGEDERRLELPAGFLELLREPAETRADVVADLLLLSSAQRTHEAVRYSEGGVTDRIQRVDAELQELFAAEFGTTLEDVLGYAPPEDDG